MNEHMEVDLGYTHIFYDEAKFNRESAGNPEDNLFGKVETSADIIAVSAKIKTWRRSPSRPIQVDAKARLTRFLFLAKLLLG